MTIELSKEQIMQVLKSVLADTSNIKLDVQAPRQEVKWVYLEDEDPIRKREYVFLTNAGERHIGIADGQEWEVISFFSYPHYEKIEGVTAFIPLPENDKIL